MTKLTKTTINFAQKRDIEVDLVEMSNHIELWISLEEDACEPDVVYYANENGTFTFKSNFALAQEIKEELPATIWNERHLREVVEFISVETK